MAESARGSSRTSCAWTYFTRESDDQARCLLCNKLYSRKGRSTTSLKNHLKSMHSDKYKELVSAKSKKLSEKDQSKNDETPMKKIELATHQQQIDSCFGFKICDASNSKSKCLDSKIAEMIVMDDLPFSHVEDVGFMRLMHCASPQCKLKTHKFYSSIICGPMYNAVSSKVRALVKDLRQDDNHISFTTDAWFDTSANVALLSLTAHAIDRDFHKVNLMLSAEPLEDRHTGEYLSQKFDSMLWKWNIPSSEVHCVLRDSGTNMKKALFLSEVKNLDCTVHKLQIIVKNGIQSQKMVTDIITKCRSLSAHFHHSVMAQDELKKVQERLQQPVLAVIHDTPTRWSSTLHMLKRMAELKEPLSLYAASNPKVAQNLPTSTEWTVLANCVSTLEPFEEITKRMSDANASVSDVIPMIQSLKSVLASTDADASCSDSDSDTDQGIRTMKSTLRREISERFGDLENNELYTLATYLDPRYKGKFFSSLHVTANVKTALARYVEAVVDDGNNSRSDKQENVKPSQVHTNAAPNVGKQKKKTLSSEINALMESSSDDEPEPGTPRVAIELVEKYASEKRLTITDEPLKWWNSNKANHPNLSHLARKYLACPPSSVASEQLFSKAGIIYDEKRNRLLGQNAEKLMFLKSNLPLIQFKYSQD